MKVNWIILKSTPQQNMDGWWEFHDELSIFFASISSNICIFFDKKNNDITVEEYDDEFFIDAKRIESVRLTVEI